LLFEQQAIRGVAESITDGWTLTGGPQSTRSKD